MLQKGSEVCTEELEQQVFENIHHHDDCKSQDPDRLMLLILVFSLRKPFSMDVLVAMLSKSEISFRR
jgi:hypothetical protein